MQQSGMCCRHLMCGKEGSMIAREFLEGYKRIITRIRQLERQIQDIEETLGVKAVSYDSQPHGSGISKVTENTAVKLAAIRDQKELLIAELWKQRLRIENEIYKMSDATYAEILRRRYIEGERWDDIAKAINAAKRWTLTLHGRALKELDNQLKKQGKEN